MRSTASDARIPALRPCLLLLLTIGLAACQGDITGEAGNGSGLADDDDDDEDAGVGHGDDDDDDTDAGSSVNGPMTSFELGESNEDLVNPERGYYVGYDLADASDTEAEWIRSQGYAMAISVVHLNAFRETPISASFLAGLEDGFEKAREGGIKIILRFNYNSSFDEDASREQILEHIEQLTPLLQEYADVIAVMQAGFIGAWGEWHASTNGLDNPEDRAAILNALLDALPASRAVQVRRPMFKETAFPGGPLTEEEAYSGTARARVGHHNDCFLASASDYGTYASPVAEWEAYVGDDGRFTANGGETCAVYEPRSSCDAAVEIMENTRWSYLNSQYNQDVIGSWDEDGCGDEIRRRLGYRFSFRRVAHTEQVAPGGELGLEVDIYNSGFASPYNLRPVEVVLSNGSSRWIAQLSGVDARRWAPNTMNTVAVTLRVPADLPAGSYTLSLRLPDASSSIAGDPRYSIRMANDGVWNSETGDNVMSEQVVIDPSAPGPRDLSATSFVQLQ
jgi:hypothetical protein